MTDKLKLPATPGMSEASAKSEHEAAAGVPPASAAISDDPLIALGRQWEEAYRNWQAAVPAGHSDEETKAYEDTRDELGKIAWGLEDQAAKVPAHSLDGVLVKLRIAARHYHLMERDGEEWGDTYARLTWQAWDSLERVAGILAPEDPVIDEPLLALERQWREAKKAMEEEESDEKKNELWTPVANAHDEICATAARSIAGVLVKLRLYGELEQENPGVPPIDQIPLSELEGAQAAVVSAMRDLERLVGGGMAVASQTAANPEPEAEAPASERQEDIRRMLAASSAAGNEKAQSMLDEGDDWREMPFIRSEAGKAVVQWPPLGITSSQEGLDPEVPCGVGRYCAMELVGHTRRYADQFGSEYLSDVVREIVRHGEWTQLEIGFFEALGNFIAWGYIRVSSDFQAFLDNTEELAGRDDTALSVLWQEWQRLWEANKKAVEEAEDDKLASEIFATLTTAEKRMEDMPAHTFTGLLSKLRVAGVWINIENHEKDKLSTAERLTLSALADLERLAGRARS